MDIVKRVSLLMKMILRTELADIRFSVEMY